MTLLHAVVFAIAVGVSPQEPATAPACHEWHACRQLALEALARGDYEHFHDLAWRTVQTGPTRDPSSMYLLARAQSLSGRPHDALVMLDRLADMGVVTDAATNDDFKVVRTLREWPDLDAKVRAISAPKAVERADDSRGGAPAATASPTPAVPVAPSAPVAAAAAPAASAVAAAPAAPAVPSERSAPVAASAPVAPSTPAAPSSTLSRTIEEAVRIGDVPFQPHGLAYDAVSSRFVVADPAARKLVIFDERSSRAIDLVRAGSAGFADITAFEIDPRRGDLWVVSDKAPAAGEGAATLHKLQLVSGRPLGRFEVPSGFDPIHVDDVAVTPGGTVLMLDGAGRRILAFDQASHAFSEAAKFEVTGATSIAPADDRTVYVAHPDGIVRVDLGSRTATPLQPAPNATLSGLRRIRWNHASLVGVQRTPDGAFKVVQVKLGNHRATVADLADAPIADPTAVTLSGSDLYVLTRAGASHDGEIVVQRIRLR